MNFYNQKISFVFVIVAFFSIVTFFITNIQAATAAPGLFTLSYENPVCDMVSPVGPAIRLNWTISAGATSYTMYRNGLLYKNMGTDRTFYNNANIVAGQTYGYYVQAKDATGSINSNGVNISIPVNICSTSAAPQINPKVSVSPSSGYRNTTFSEPGEGFTPYGRANLHFRLPDNSEQFATETADSQGRYAHSWIASSSALIGAYAYWAIDETTGKQSPTVSFTVLSSPAPVTPKPIVSIVAVPNNIPYNSQVTIVWNSTNANSCVVSPNNWTSISDNKTEILTSSKTYTVNCSGPGGSVYNSVTVTVNPQPQNPIIPALPIVPSNSSTTALSSSHIVLVFQDNAGNESGFKIERKIPGGMFSQISVAGAISGSGSAGYYEDAGLLGSTNYCYRVRAYNSVGDSTYSNETCATTQTASLIQPIANTGSASNFTSSSATLNSAVNPNRTATGAFFQWGNSSTFGNTTSSQTIGNSNTNINVSANLTGLMPATTYYFRIVVVNNAGTVFGATQTFITQMSQEIPTANLVVENFTIDKQSVNAGDTVKMQFIVRNQGGIASQPFSVRILLASDNNNLTSGRELFNSSISFPSINPNSSRGWSGNNYINLLIPTNTQTGTYYIGILTDNGLQKSLSIVVTGKDVPSLPKPTANIIASAAPVSYSSATKIITWKSTNATNCTVSPDGWTGTSGSQTVTLASSKTYILNCSGLGGLISDTITIQLDSTSFNTNFATELACKQNIDVRLASLRDNYKKLQTLRLGGGVTVIGLPSVLITDFIAKAELEQKYRDALDSSIQYAEMISDAGIKNSNGNTEGANSVLASAKSLRNSTQSNIESVETYILVAIRMYAGVLVAAAEVSQVAFELVSCAINIEACYSFLALTLPNALTTSTPTLSPQSPSLPTPQPQSSPAFSTLSISDGDTIKTADNPDVCIVKTINNKKFKRLVLSPRVFNSYGHLKWGDVKVVSPEVFNEYAISSLVRADGDCNVFELSPSGDTGIKTWIKNENEFLSKGFDWDAVYTINSTDRDSYDGNGGVCVW